MANTQLQVAGINVDEIITVSNSDLRTHSITVSKIFGKRHDDLLKKIRTLDCSPKFIARNFAEIPVDVDLKHGRVRKSTAYEMTKDGFIFLVMGFTGKRAAGIKEAYIEAFNLMADKLTQQQPAQPDPRMIGAPLLNDVVQKEINRWAKVLQNRTYSHYKNRLLEEALKDFPQTAAEIELLAETVWFNERTREEIDGIPVTTLKRAYELCINYFNGYNQNLPEHVQYTHRQCWEKDMRAFGEMVKR